MDKLSYSVMNQRGGIYEENSGTPDIQTAQGTKSGFGGTGEAAPDAIGGMYSPVFGGFFSERYGKAEWISAGIDAAFANERGFSPDLCKSGVVGSLRETGGKNAE